MRGLVLCGLVLLTACVALPANGKPRSLAAEARFVAQHGGVTGSCHECATPRMQRLAYRLVAARFAEAGPGAVQTALCIVRRESGGNPAAVSATGDYGLPQMNYVAHHSDFPSWWQPARGFRYLIFDPAYAAGAMFAMSKRGTDWGPWRGGTYSC